MFLKSSLTSLLDMIEVVKDIIVKLNEECHKFFSDLAKYVTLHYV